MSTSAWNSPVRYYHPRLWLLALLIGVAPSASPQIIFPIEKPSFKPGDRWTYRRIDGWNNTERSRTEIEFVSTEPERWVFRSKNASGAFTTFRTNFDLQPCRAMRGSDQEVCTGAFKFPMSADFQNTYDKLPWMNGEGHSSARCEAKGNEDVTVPAGTFPAIRIECKGFWHRVFDLQQGGRSGRQEEIYWYSSVAKRPVKSQFVNSRPDGNPFDKWIDELVEFRPAP